MGLPQKPTCQYLAVPSTGVLVFGILDADRQTALAAYLLTRGMTRGTCAEVAIDKRLGSPLAAIPRVLQLRIAPGLVPAKGCQPCCFDDGTMADVPGILVRFLQRGDQLRFLGANTEVLIQRPIGRRCQQILHVTIGYVGLPKPGRNGDSFVRAELPNCPDGPKALILTVLSQTR